MSAFFLSQQRYSSATILQLKRRFQGQKPTWKNRLFQIKKIQFSLKQKKLAQKRAGKKIDVDQIDMERMEEMTTENPGIIPFPHTVGGAMIKPEDKGKIKGRSLSAMYEQTDLDMKQIYEQMQLLAKQAETIQTRVEVSERIYQAKMTFQPLIGKIYHLYTNKKGGDVLSMVAPAEWGVNMPFQAFICTAKLLSDHTWEILEKGE